MNSFCAVMVLVLTLWFFEVGLINTQDTDSMELLLHLQEWLLTDPTVALGGVSLQAAEKLSSLPWKYNKFYSLRVFTNKVWERPAEYHWSISQCWNSSTSCCLHLVCYGSGVFLHKIQNTKTFYVSFYTFLCHLYFELASC